MQHFHLLMLVPLAQATRCGQRLLNTQTIIPAQLYFVDPCLVCLSFFVLYPLLLPQIKQFKQQISPMPSIIPSEQYYLPHCHNHQTHIYIIFIYHFSHAQASQYSLRTPSPQKFMPLRSKISLQSHQIFKLKRKSIKTSF